MSPIRYLLRDGTEASPKVWSALQRDARYIRVAEAVLAGGRWVSTVWTGVEDGEGAAIFETIVFSEEDRVPLDRAAYQTESQAKAGHEAMLRKWSGESQAQTTEPTPVAPKR